MEKLKIDPLFLLTNREKEILDLLKQGKSSRDIASLLRISASTANFHVKNILRKMQVKKRMHAVVIAMAAEFKPLVQRPR